MTNLQLALEKIKVFICTKEFVAGIILGFALGALHNYYGL